MYSLNDEPNSEQNASTMMATCMNAIHDLVLHPMKDKLTPEDDAVMSLVGITLKIIAEKAHAYEKMEQGKLPDSKENDFFRN